jgi:hypothetical protein
LAFELTSATNKYKAKMKNIFLFALLLIAGVLFSQSPGTPDIQFQSAFRITNATNGTGDTVVISGYVDECAGRFTNSDIAIGDSLYVLEGSDLLVFGAVTTRSISLGIATFKAIDFGGAGILPSNGQAAIFRPTTNYQFPGDICGLNPNLQQYITARFMMRLDEFLNEKIDSTTLADSLLVIRDSLFEIRNDIVPGGGGVGKGYIIQDSAPVDTLYKWVDRTTWDSTSIFHVKEYILGEGWKTTGYLDTINYAYSSHPAIYVVVVGQSNATPRAGQTATVSDTIASPLTTIWNGEGDYWGSLHTGKQWMNGTFPGRSVWWPLSFGKSAAEEEDKIIKIVYHAGGGLTIDNFFTDSLHWDTLTQRIIDSNIPRIDAVLWYQGETDGWTGRRPEQYSEDWFRVMAQFQALQEWHEGTKVIAVQLNTGEISGDITGFPSGEMANTVFNYLANDSYEWTYVAKNDGVVVSDSSHINADGHVALGKHLWDIYTGKLTYNPLQRYGRGVFNMDSLVINYNNSVVTLATATGDNSIVVGYKNFNDGWTGFLRVINDGVNIVPPDGQMFCQTENAEIIEIDTIFGKYLSPGYLRNDTLILSQCPIGGNFTETVPLPLALGVFAWYDAEQEDELYYNDGAEVTTLHDFSGNDINLTNTGTPLLKSNAINGKASVVFNSGNTDYFTLADTTFSFLHYDSSTVVIIFKPGSDAVTNPDSAYSVITSQTQPGSAFKGFSIYYDDRSGVGSNEKMVNLVSNGSALVTQPSFITNAPPNEFNYVYVKTDPENGTAALRSSVRVNDGAYNSGNVQTGTPSVTTMPAFEIGRFSAGTPFYLTGEIAEIQIYNRSLTSIELSKMINYVNRKFDFNLNP